MTAAAKTGPDKQPLPASSHPASTTPLCMQNESGINLFDTFLLTKQFL